MDIISALGGVNRLAVLLAVVASQAVGMVWYSPVLFMDAWMSEIGMTKEKLKECSMMKTMGTSVLCTVIIATVMAMLFGGTGRHLGLTNGLLIGVGLVSAMTTMHYVYSGYSMRYLLITVGFDILIFAVLGTIIGGM